MALSTFPHAEVERVTAKLNHKLLPFSWHKYPEPGQHTAILLLLDISDLARAAEISHEKLKLFYLANRADPTYDRVSIAVYADKAPKLLFPANSKIDALGNMVVGTIPRAAPGKLTQALQDAIRLLEKAPENRRGLFIFSDGHSDDVLKSKALIDAAKRANIAINFVLDPSSRHVDRLALKTIATSTGGLVIPDFEFDAFVKDPFVLLDSGAIAHFPFTRSPRYIWQSNPKLTVAFEYGKKRLVLSEPVVVPLEGVLGTSRYIVQSFPVSFVAGVVLLVGFGGFSTIIVGGRLRRKSDKNDLGKYGEPLAVLQNVDTGTIYPIWKCEVHIGRARSNDIVIDDATVSKQHALLKQDEAGVSIRDKATVNGTLVNERRIQENRRWLTGI